MTWIQPPLEIEGAEETTHTIGKPKNTEPQPEKCGQCGQWVRKAYLSGSAVDIAALGQEMVFEAEPVIGGDYFFAGHITYRLLSAEKPEVAHLAFYKEHRCPGFKS